MSQPHAVVVLAAGGSTRLGQPKQLLTRDGETLVHRAARLALATSPAQVLVVVGANPDSIAASVADLDCEVVGNREWQSGLAGSLHAAGQHLAPDIRSVLVLVCDQPALERRHLDALLEGARATASGCAATVHADAPGVPAVVPRGWFETMPADASRGFGARLRQQPADGIFLLETRELGMDIDSPQDLAIARERGWLDD
ncbi:MAG TPA: nucleotidyltransferase family protein [Thermomonas sp.]|nr:nucleotidyltransferase family protein [Thermomonas sp.]